MSTDNSQQIADWNGPMGERWAALQRDTDRIVAPFGDAALKIAAAQPGERVLDIGCGCGDTSIRSSSVPAFGTRTSKRADLSPLPSFMSC